jgi:translation elongation factor EF-Tu-like GTPase
MQPDWTLAETWKRRDEEHYRDHIRPPQPIHAIARISMRRTEDGGRVNPVFPGYRGQFYYDDHDWDAQWIFASDGVLPGGSDEVILQFASPHAHVGRLFPGKEFLMKEGFQVVGEGVITWVCDEFAGPTKDTSE